MGRILSLENTMFVMTRVAFQFAFFALFVATEHAACFVPNSIAQDDALHSTAADGRSLRCKPISSTISPHILHVPPPIHSTKESAFLDEIRKKARNKRENGRTNNSKESARFLLRQKAVVPHNTSAAVPTTEQRKERSKNEIGFAKPDAHQKIHVTLSDSELLSLTNKLLAEWSQASQMSASDIDEAKRLLSSWGGRTTKQSGPMAEKIFKRLLDEKTSRNKKSVPTVGMLHTVSRYMSVVGICILGFCFDSFCGAITYDCMFFAFTGSQCMDM